MTMLYRVTRTRLIRASSPRQARAYHDALDHVDGWRTLPDDALAAADRITVESLGHVSPSEWEQRRRAEIGRARLRGIG